MGAGLSCSPRIRPCERLSRFSSIRIGGPVSAVISVSGLPEMEEVFSLRSREEIPGPLHFVGRGSNILFPDRGLEGTLVRLEAADLSSACRWREGGEVYVEAGYPLPALAREAARRGIGGFEFLSGIPGTVGGATVMNAGAGGREWASLCRSVTIMTPAGSLETLPAERMAYGYRTSLFGRKRPSGPEDTGSGHLPEGSVVLGALLSGFLARPEECQAGLARHLEYRKKTQPIDEPSLGSVFRNPSKGPPGYTAGRLIEEAGLKGEFRGGVMVSRRHANFFVNAGGGCERDFRELLDYVSSRVREHWGIVLEPEVKVWNA